MNMISKHQQLMSLKARAKESKWDVIFAQKLIQIENEYHSENFQSLSQSFTEKEDGEARDVSDVFVYMDQIDGIFYKKLITPYGVQLLLIPFKMHESEGVFSFTRKKMNFRSIRSLALNRKYGSHETNDSIQILEQGDIVQKKEDKKVLDRHIKPLSEITSEFRSAFARCSHVAQLILSSINLSVDIHANTKDSYYYTYGDKQVDITIMSAVLTHGEVHYKYSMDNNGKASESVDISAANLMNLHPIHAYFPKLHMYFVNVEEVEGFLEYVDIRSSEIAELKTKTGHEWAVPDYSALSSFLGIFGFLLGILNMVAFLANPDFALIDVLGYDIAAIISVAILCGYKYMKIKDEFESKHNLAKIIVDPVTEMIDVSCIGYLKDILERFPTPTSRTQFIIEHYASWKEDALEKKDTAEMLTTLMRSLSRQAKRKVKEEFGGIITPGIYEKLIEQPEIADTLSELSGEKLNGLIKQYYSAGDYTFISELLLVKLHLKLEQIVPPSEPTDESEGADGREGIKANEEILTHELFSQYIAKHSVQIPNNLTDEIENWEHIVVNKLPISKTQFGAIAQIQKQVNTLLSNIKPLIKKGTVPAQSLGENISNNEEDSNKVIKDDISNSEYPEMQDMQESQKESISSKSQEEFQDAPLKDEFIGSDVPRVIAAPPDPKVLVASNPVSHKILFGNKSFEEDFIRGRL